VLLITILALGKIATAGWPAAARVPGGAQPPPEKRMLTQDVPLVIILLYEMRS
jgi:hypothetical protein